MEKEYNLKNTEIGDHLPEKSNLGLQDCGVFTAYFCAKFFGKIDEYPEDLCEMRENLGKKQENGTAPGEIIKFLHEKNLRVQYYTALDWETINTLSKKERGEFCKKINNSVNENMVDARAIEKSAKYINENKEILNEWRDKNPIDVFKKELEKNSKIILLVNASHYVVLTSVNEKTFTIYDPNDPTETKTLLKEDLVYIWDLTNKNIFLNNKPLNFKEAIIVSKKEP